MAGDDEKLQNDGQRTLPWPAMRRPEPSSHTGLKVVVAIVAVVGLAAAIIIPNTGTHKKKTKVAVSVTTTTHPIGGFFGAAQTPTTLSLKPVSAGATITGDTPCPQADGSSPRTTKFAKYPPMCIDPAKSYVAEIKTTKGTITVALDPKKAPMAVNNFVVLARYHYYDGIAFHRIVNGYVDQVGDPTETGNGGPGYTFNDELPQPGDYKAGSVAMANAGINTNGSQFFILVSDTAAKQLVDAVGGQAKYSLFGQVTGGLDVATAINSEAGSDDGTPLELVRIDSVTIQEK